MCRNKQLALRAWGAAGEVVGQGHSGHMVPMLRESLGAHGENVIPYPGRASEVGRWKEGVERYLGRSCRQGKRCGSGWCWRSAEPGLELCPELKAGDRVH